MSQSESSVYLSSNDIHELFQGCSNTNTKSKREKQPTIPSFGDLHSNQSSPQFQSHVFFNQDSCVSTLARDDKASTHQTNRHTTDNFFNEVNDDMMLITKQQFDKITSDTEKYKIVELILNQAKLQEEINTLKSTISSQNITITKLQKTIVQCKEVNKRQHSHIYELLQAIKKMEKDNHSYQDTILQCKLALQDQIRLQQQHRIDQERFKLDILGKDEQIFQLNEQLDNYISELQRVKNSRSVQRSTCISNNNTIEYSPLKQSYPSQPSIHLQNRSFSNNIKPRMLIKSNQS